MSSRRDDDLEELLAELESTLGALRTELARRPEARPRRIPRPPTPGEVLRFTEEYTIPTVIAVLEATIRSLELLQRVLRLADPARAVGEESRAASGRVAPGVREASRTAADGLERALTELQRALSEGDLPSDPESRSIIEDARELSAEIERRIADERTRREGDRYGIRRPDAEDDRRDRRARMDRGDLRDRRAGNGGGIRIAVDEERDETDDEGAETDESPRVDIDAELRSIKDELGDPDDLDDGSDEPEGSDEPAEPDEPGENR
jgi:hypothetical protein